MSNIRLFESKKVRTQWSETQQKWYFSIVDVIQILTESPNPRKYWSVLKTRLKKEGSQLATNCSQLKMQSSDGKFYLTDVADTEQLLRLIQTIPSPKAEPFKHWLARVGYERIEEMNDPEKALNRSRSYWQKKGRSEKWIQQRMMGQETRNKLTDYWSGHGVNKSDEFAILTNIIHEEWSGVTVKKHKNIKGLKSQNLRDHMSDAELIFTALAELSTRQIAENMEAEGFVENKVPAKKGGKISKDARKALEKKSGKPVVTGENYLPQSRTQKVLK